MMRKQENGSIVDLSDLRLARMLNWETNQDGSVVLLVPKFRNRYLVRWLVPHIAQPSFRVKLDAHGSFVWNCCDGATTVSEIARKMERTFGEPIDSLNERIGLFIGRLMRDKFLIIEKTTIQQTDKEKNCVKCN